MNETIICAVGNVATQPVYRELAAGPSARFRLAVTSRYWDREKSAWLDGHTNFFTVWANRQLATNAAASLSVGDPVVVQGRLKVRTDVREGQSWTSADLDAMSIGHDLARGTSAFRRANKPEPTAVHRPEPDWRTPAARTGATDGADTADTAGAAGAAGAEDTGDTRGAEDADDTDNTGATGAAWATGDADGVEGQGGPDDPDASHGSHGSHSSRRSHGSRSSRGSVGRSKAGTAAVT